MICNIPRRRRGSAVLVVALSHFLNNFVSPAQHHRHLLLGGGYYFSSAFVVNFASTVVVPRSLSVSSSPSSSFPSQHRDIGGGESWRIKAANNKNDDEPRTGWLHNIEPKEYYRTAAATTAAADNKDINIDPPTLSTSSVDFTSSDITKEEVVATSPPPTTAAFASNIIASYNPPPRTPKVATMEANKNNTPSPSKSSSTTYLSTGVDWDLPKLMNHRILSPPSFHPSDGTTKFMVTEHKISVPLYHVDLNLNENMARIAAMVLAEKTDEDAKKRKRNSVTTENNNSIKALDRKALLRPPMDVRTIDVYFVVIETCSGSDEEFIASISNPSMCPRARADAYLMRGASTATGGSGGEGAGDSPSIDPSRMMLYLQGGPGFGCAAPSVGLGLGTSSSSWAAKALSGGGVTNIEGKSFERVVLMDQRGTGKSSPISKRRLEKLFPDLFLLDDVGKEEDNGDKKAKVSKAVADATEYLARFRADSIVRDAEWVKEALIRRPSPTAATTGGEEKKEKAEEASVEEPQPWGAALGQSYGGFCLMTYLSSIAHPPKLCLFTGGIAPAYTPVREVYDRLWLRVAERNYKFYNRYPGDVGIVKRIVRRLSSSSMPPVKLPSGAVLTARRFLQLGLGLGGSPGSSFANLHSLINSAFLHDDDDDELSGAFLKRIDHEQSFDDAPLYFLLHESIYADGLMSGPTEWAAHSSYEGIIVSTHPEFDYRQTSIIDDHAHPTLFFGEMVFPWMAHGDYAELSGHGMRKLSETLATKRDWSPLYDKLNMRTALLGEGANKPPKSKAASATYYDDMYVDFNCAMKLLGRGAPLEGVKVWITNEYQHSGLRDDGANILSRLVNMAKENVHLPS